MSTSPMLVFAVSDKGGTGRSVTACNVAYRLSCQGKDVAYLDFDFGSPTAGAIFELTKVERGTDKGGLHAYFEGEVTSPQQVDVRANSSRRALRVLHSNAGRLVLFPGDRGGAEFARVRDDHVPRCTELLQQLLHQEFDVCVVDLSAGRSYAAHMVLQATARPELHEVGVRWLVFHRWTRQHIMAAHSLVYGPHGLLQAGEGFGHDREALRDAIRFVRTAVPALNQPHSAERPAQAKWLRACNDDLKQLALRHEMGNTLTLGETPMEPMLQWREQIISDADVADKIANESTANAFKDLSKNLFDAAVWEGL